MLLITQYITTDNSIQRERNLQLGFYQKKIAEINEETQKIETEYVIYKQRNRAVNVHRHTCTQTHRYTHKHTHRHKYKKVKTELN